MREYLAFRLWYGAKLARYWDYIPDRLAMRWETFTNAISGKAKLS